MTTVAGTSSPARRVAGHLLGPPLPPPRVLWAAHGRRALSAAACVGAPLAFFVLLGRADLGAAAALGGFTAVYGHTLPYRRRARVSAGVGAFLVGAVALGGLTGPHVFLLAGVLGLLAATATAATAVWHVGPPGPLMAVLVGGSASALGAAPGQVGEHVAAAAGSAVLAWLVVMAGWLWDPAGPERRAVAAAEDAVAAGTPPDGRPDPVARAVRVAHAAVADGSTRRPSLWPRLVEVEDRFLRTLPAVEAAVPAAARGAVRSGRTRWHPPLWLPTAARIGLGTWAAGTLAAGLGLHSPYWAATAAIAVLLGTDARHARARALHRVTGTLLGTVLTAVLFWLDLPDGVTVAVVGVMLVCVELLVVNQYVLAVSLITPVSLSLVHLGADSPAGADLITVRLGETVVGIVVGLAAGLLLFPRTGSRRLPAAVGTTVRLALAAAAARPGTPADRALRDALVAQHEVATAARAELFAAPGADEALRWSRQVADLGWALLGARAREEDALAAWVAARVQHDLG